VQINSPSMKGSEKILSVIIAILVAIVIVLSVLRQQSEVEIGAKEYVIIELRKSRIAMYNNQIDSLNRIILTLQTERTKIDVQESKVRIVTIREIDSIARLPYDEQSIYIANGLSSLDSIKRRYFSGL
jgi:hypothetical protein